LLDSAPDRSSTIGTHHHATSSPGFRFSVECA
jgi:hypothetical protein